MPDLATKYVKLAQKKKDILFVKKGLEGTLGMYSRQAKKNMDHAYEGSGHLQAFHMCSEKDRDIDLASLQARTGSEYFWTCTGVPTAKEQRLAVAKLSASYSSDCASERS